MCHTELHGWLMALLNGGNHSAVLSLHVYAIGFILLTESRLNEAIYLDELRYSDDTDWQI